MSKYRSGAIIQGGLNHQRADFLHEEIAFPMTGVILNVYCADDALNTLSSNVDNKTAAGCQARVRILNQGTSSPIELPNVLICPTGGSGADDYAEELPKGTTGTIDGTPLTEDTDPTRFNGDWCVVWFIGGSIHQPVMASFFPHPGNRRDPTTQNSDLGNLAQGRRWVKRFAGARTIITSKGSVFVDTSESNTKLKGDMVSRTTEASGGDVRITVKKERELEVNFNPSVFDPNEPDLLYAPNQRQEQERATTSSRLLADQDFIRALAGKVVEIQGTEKVVIGDKDSAAENFVLGQEFKTLLSSLIADLLTHTHGTGVGPSTPPLAPELGTMTTLKAGVDAENQLSTWIFGQKDPV